MVHGLNEGRTAPYTDIVYQLKYQNINHNHIIRSIIMAETGRKCDTVVNNKTGKGKWN